MNIQIKASLQLLERFPNSDQRPQAIKNIRVRIEDLETALEEAVELIKQWHNIDIADVLTKDEHERTWEIYQELSPEMRNINAVLKGKTS